MTCHMIVKIRLLFIYCLILGVFLYSCSGRKETAFISPHLSNLEVAKESIDYYANNPNLFNAQVGIYIELLDTGEIIYKRNEHKLFMPASNMKLFTSAVALLKFGPNFQYQTNIFIKDSIINGTLHGDIVIKGSGDPTIEPTFSTGDVRNILVTWADTLLNLGINAIDGDIVGDESYFQNERLGYGWQWDYESYYYAAQVGALSINENCVDVTVIANEQVGLPPKIEIFPPTNYFSVENTATTIAPDSVRTLNVTRVRSKNIIVVKDQIPQNKPVYNQSITVEDPGLFFVHLFAQVLMERGIQFRGELKTVKENRVIDYLNLKEVIIHKSPTLATIIKLMNKPSNNLYAEQLLLTLGAEYGAAGTAEEGVKVINQTLSRMGIPENEFIMCDGSGLSRHNLITPSAIVALLRYMSKHNYYDSFYDSLPIAGIDGTIKNRLKGSLAENNVRAKTGHVGRVSNLSGYINSINGRNYIFSILVNNFTVPTKAVHHLQESVCLIICQI